MDHEQLRRVAATRPGYATYPNTRPGSPHWLRARQPGPCTWADRPGAGLLCVRADHQHGERTHDGTPGPLPPVPDCCYPPDAVALPKPPPDTSWLRTTQPRRRWWHRLVRRSR